MGRRRSRVEAFLREHLAEEIDVSMLAKVAGLSVYHFSRAFRAEFAESPWQFVRRSRVERAKVLLASSTRSVLGIGLDVGFTSASQFAQAFRDVVGMSPSEYRARTSRSVDVKEVTAAATRSGASR